MSSGINTLETNIKGIGETSGAQFVRWLRTLLGKENEYDKILNTIDEIKSLVQGRLEIQQLKEELPKSRESLANMQASQTALSAEQQKGKKTIEALEKQPVLSITNWAPKPLSKEQVKELAQLKSRDAELTRKLPDLHDKIVKLSDEIQAKEAKLQALEHPPIVALEGTYDFKLTALFGFGLGQKESLEEVGASEGFTLSEIGLDQGTVLGSPIG